MPAADEAFAVQQLPHLSGPIGLPCLLMEDAHSVDEELVGLRTRARGAVLPGVETTPADL
jgi:hypothetical protein